MAQKSKTTLQFQFNKITIAVIALTFIIGFFLGAQFQISKQLKKGCPEKRCPSFTTQTYTNDQFGFQFEYPYTYLVQENTRPDGVTSISIQKNVDDEYAPITIYVGSPLIERTDYYYGGMNWTKDIIDRTAGIADGEKVMGGKENITKNKDESIDAFKGVRYISEPTIEGSKMINVAIQNDKLTLLITGSNMSSPLGIDAGFDMEAFDQIVSSIKSTK